MTANIKYLVAATLMLVACGKNNSVTIKGTFSGVDDKTVYIDRISVHSNTLVDSAKTDGKGRFKVKVKLPDNNPTFYHVRCNDQVITLLLSPGDKVNIKSLCNLARNYIVEGSKGSEEIRELNDIMYEAREKLDSLTDLYLTLPADDSQRAEIQTQYSRAFVQQKRDIIRFIVDNPTSLSSVYAVYQRLPDGNSIFNDEKDIVYYRLIADSLGNRYPGSPHVKSLLQDMVQIENSLKLSSMLLNAGISELSFPDIELPDVYGNRVKLSSVEDKVILLDFWLASSPQSRILNAELSEIYQKYSEKGFEIYQVALDESRATWVTAVRDQRLPWISVSDLKGLASPAARVYGVNGLPSNVLINRQGEIVARNIPPDQLEEQVKRLMR